MHIGLSGTSPPARPSGKFAGLDKAFRGVSPCSDANCGCCGPPTTPRIHYLSILVYTSSVMEMVECSLPPMKLQPWDKECYALISRTKRSVTLIYASTSFEDVKNHGIARYGEGADVPIDTLINYDTYNKTWKQYILCEYKVCLYYKYLSERKMRTWIGVDEIDGREVLIFAGVSKNSKARLIHDD